MKTKTAELQIHINFNHTRTALFFFMPSIYANISSRQININVNESIEQSKNTLEIIFEDPVFSLNWLNKFCTI